MAKQKPTTDKSQMIVVGIVAVVVIIVGVVMLVMPNNVPTNTTAQISPAEYQSQFDGEPHFLLDVRTPEEFATGHIAGAANISVQTLAERLSEVPEDQPVVVYCRSGNRSAQAAQILQEAGYSSVYDLGGVNAWTAAGFPLQ